MVLQNKSKTNNIIIQHLFHIHQQVQFWTSELEKRQKRHEGQSKHVKQGSLSSSSSNSTVSSIASKYDVNQLKKEISQAKSRVRKHPKSFELTI